MLITGHKKYHLLFFTSIMFMAFAVSCKHKQAAGHAHEKASTEIYTCPMHPEIIKGSAGTCPVCGMQLVKKGGDEQKVTEVNLNTLIKPANTFVISSIPVTTAEINSQPIQVDALGSIAYDTKQVGTISARFAGRIEKLYLRYRFQKVSKGQKIMDIYSPELMTAQQNLLFLLTNDAANTPLISAAKQRLLLLGLNDKQVGTLIRTRQPSFAVSVYSNYSGHIHETSGNTMAAPTAGMRDLTLRTEELNLKEGMYIQKGQPLFVVYNPNKVWALLNIYAEMQSLVKVGDPVVIVPETGPNKQFRGEINFIEPFFRDNSKTITARVYVDNSQLQIPVGSQVKGTIIGTNRNAKWLPVSSVVSLGLDKIVFMKQAGGFKAHKVVTGLSYQNKIQLISGLEPTDTVAQNAQYLIDSESFIKVNR